MREGAGGVVVAWVLCVMDDTVEVDVAVVGGVSMRWTN